MTATGSASSIPKRPCQTAVRVAGTVLKIPSMSFYEYCRLLQLEEPKLPDGLILSEFVKMSDAEKG